MSVVCQVSICAGFSVHTEYTHLLPRTSPLLSFPGKEDEMKEFQPQKEYLQLKIGPVRAEKGIRGTKRSFPCARSPGRGELLNCAR